MLVDVGVNEVFVTSWGARWEGDLGGLRNEGEMRLGRCGVADGSGLPG